jgi:hypothetical protein
MVKRPTRKRKNWSLNVPDEIRDPRNFDHQETALSFLGPFKYKTQAEAVANGCYFENGKAHYGVSREFAAQLIEDAAKTFNVELHLEYGAPRFKQVAAALLKTQRLANSLASHLNSLDDITRHALQFAGDYEGNLNYLRAHMQAADVQRLPKSSTENEPNSSLWVLRLTKLSSYAGITHNNLLAGRKKRSLPIKDSGGNTNLWKEEMGIPRWGLVNDALKIYEIFKPGKATATVGGSFHKFVHGVFEYATGKEAAIYAKVDEFLKDLVKVNREDRQLKEMEERLEVELEKLMDGDPRLYPSTNSDRVMQIREELRKISSRRKAYWRQMFPHVRFQINPKADH